MFDARGGGEASIYFPDGLGGLGGRPPPRSMSNPGEQYKIDAGRAAASWTTRASRPRAAGAVWSVGERRIIGEGGGGAGRPHPALRAGARDAGGAAGDRPARSTRPECAPGGLVDRELRPIPARHRHRVGSRGAHQRQHADLLVRLGRDGRQLPVLRRVRLRELLGAWRDTHDRAALRRGAHGRRDLDRRRGLPDPTPATRTFTVDTKAPGVKITSRPRGTVKTDGRGAKVAVSFKSIESKPPSSAGSTDGTTGGVPPPIPSARGRARRRQAQDLRPRNGRRRQCRSRGSSNSRPSVRGSHTFPPGPRSSAG